MSQYKFTVLANKITQKTLNDLEFNTVLKRIEEYCISDLGREKVIQIKPFSRLLELKEELNQVNEYLSSFENENKLPNHYFDEITNEINILDEEEKVYIDLEIAKKFGINEVEFENDMKRIVEFFLNKFSDYIDLLPSGIQDLPFYSGYYSLHKPFKSILEKYY